MHARVADARVVNTYTAAPGHALRIAASGAGVQATACAAFPARRGLLAAPRRRTTPGAARLSRTAIFPEPGHIAIYTQVTSLLQPM